VTFEEVVQALYAPPGLRYERRAGDLLMFVAGLALSKRVIDVVCDRTEHASTYEIVGAHVIVEPELSEWRREVL
jgi:hypothetical protein